jgi:hypothetical protein
MSIKINIDIDDLVMERGDRFEIYTEDKHWVHVHYAKDGILKITNESNSPRHSARDIVRIELDGRMTQITGIEEEGMTHEPLDMPCYGFPQGKLGALLPWTHNEEASLITAAPELLEACQIALDAIEWQVDAQSAYVACRLREAIALATRKAL